MWIGNLEKSKLQCVEVYWSCVVQVLVLRETNDGDGEGEKKGFGSMRRVFLPLATYNNIHFSRCVTIFLIMTSTTTSFISLKGNEGGSLPWKQRIRAAVDGETGDTACH